MVLQGPRARVGLPKKKAAREIPSGLFRILRPVAAKSGAAARLARIVRATAHATYDSGQRKKLVPLPE
jgi:hypothetical protein